MKPTSTPVTSGRHQQPAPQAAELPSAAQRRPHAISWLVGQLHWEHHLDHLRNKHKVARREVPPTVAPAIESSTSPERAVRAPSYAGPARADAATAAVPAGPPEVPVVIVASPSPTKR